MRTVRERPRVVIAGAVAVLLLVVIFLLLAGGGVDDQQLSDAQDSTEAANKRADRAEGELAEVKARLSQQNQDLRGARAATRRAQRRAAAATRRSRQLRRALNRERR